MDRKGLSTSAKRTGAALICAVTLLAALVFLPLTASAEERDANGGGVTDELVGRLPDLVVERLPEGAGSEDVSELFGAEYLTSFILSGISGEGSGFLSELLRLCGLTLISAAAMLVGRNLKSPRNARLVESAVLIAGASSAFSMMQGALGRAFAYLEDAAELSRGLIPIVSGIYVAGGSTSSAAVSTAVIGATAAVIESVCISALAPVVYVCFGFVSVTALGGELDTSGIARTVRNCYVTLVTLSLVILTAMLSFQGSIAAASDSLAARTVKFAAGKLIPIVGGSVGDSLRTVGASLSLVKSTVGAASVFALLAIAVPPLVSLLLGRFMLNISAGVAALVGCSRMKKLFEELRGIYDVMCAVVAASSVELIIILTVFIKTALAIA